VKEHFGHFIREKIRTNFENTGAMDEPDSAQHTVPISELG